MMNRIFLILCLNVLSIAAVHAQDWKSVLKGVAESVGKEVGEKMSEKVKVFSMEGNWNYVKPECEFITENGDILSKAGSEIVSKKIEEQIARVMEKLHVDSTSVFTFNTDSSYAITLGQRTIHGTYSINTETKEITLISRLQKSHTAKISQNILEPGKVTLLFKADKLMNFVQNIAGSLTKSSTNATLKAVTSIFNQYDGLMLGYQLKKMNQESSSCVSDSADSVLNVLENK